MKAAVSPEVLENIRESKRRWKRANKEKARQYQRKWEKENVAKLRTRRREASRRWRAAHPERHREKSRAWCAEHPDYVRAATQTRRARKQGSDGRGVSASEWNEILEVFDHRCAYCGAKTELQLEHFRPLSKGGEHDVQNVVPACSACNHAKYNYLIFDWLPMLAAR